MTPTVAGSLGRELRTCCAKSVKATRLTSELSDEFSLDRLSIEA
jgi:hypothetical protein